MSRASKDNSSVVSEDFDVFDQVVNHVEERKREDEEFFKSEDEKEKEHPHTEKENERSLKSENVSNSPAVSSRQSDQIDDEEKCTTVFTNAVTQQPTPSPTIEYFDGFKSNRVYTPDVRDSFDSIVVSNINNNNKSEIVYKDDAENTIEDTKQQHLPQETNHQNNNNNKSVLNYVGEQKEVPTTKISNEEEDNFAANPRDVNNNEIENVSSSEENGMDGSPTEDDVESQQSVDKANPENMVTDTTTSDDRESVSEQQHNTSDEDDFAPSQKDESNDYGGEKDNATIVSMYRMKENKLSSDEEDDIKEKQQQQSDEAKSIKEDENNIKHEEIKDSNSGKQVEKQEDPVQDRSFETFNEGEKKEDTENEDIVEKDEKIEEKDKSAANIDTFEETEKQKEVENESHGDNEKSEKDENNKIYEDNEYEEKSNEKDGNETKAKDEQNVVDEDNTDHQEGDEDEMLDEIMQDLSKGNETDQQQETDGGDDEGEDEEKKENNESEGGENEKEEEKETEKVKEKLIIQPKKKEVIFKREGDSFDNTGDRRYDVSALEMVSEDESEFVNLQEVQQARVELEQYAKNLDNFNHIISELEKTPEEKRQDEPKSLSFRLDELMIETDGGDEKVKTPKSSKKKKKKNLKKKDDKGIVNGKACQECRQPIFKNDSYVELNDVFNGKVTCKICLSKKRTMRNQSSVKSQDDSVRSRKEIKPALDSRLQSSENSALKKWLEAKNKEERKKKREERREHKMKIKENKLKKKQEAERQERVKQQVAHWEETKRKQAIQNNKKKNISPSLKLNSRPIVHSLGSTTTNSTNESPRSDATFQVVEENSFEKFHEDIFGVSTAPLELNYSSVADFTQSVILSALLEIEKEKQTQGKQKKLVMNRPKSHAPSLKHNKQQQRTQQQLQPRPPPKSANPRNKRPRRPNQSNGHTSSNDSSMKRSSLMRSKTYDEWLVDKQTQQSLKEKEREINNHYDLLQQKLLELEKDRRKALVEIRQSSLASFNNDQSLLPKLSNGDTKKNEASLIMTKN